MRPSGSNVRSLLIPLVKWTLSIALLAWVFSKTNFQEILRHLAVVQWGFLVPAILLAIAPLCINAWRWCTLLRAFGGRARFRSLFATTWIGQFFSLFLPGPLGDDTVRALYASRLIQAAESTKYFSIFLDRVLGLGSALLLALLTLPLHWNVLLTHSTASRTLAWTTLGVALPILAAFSLPFWIGKASARALLSPLGQHALLEPFAQRASTLLELLPQNRPTLLRVSLGAFVAHFCVCNAFCAVGWAMHIPVSWSDWLSFMPILLLSGALPITIAGIGIRDYLLLFFLHDLRGVEASHALALSFVMLALQLFLALCGAIVYACFQPPPATTLPNDPVLTPIHPEAPLL